MIPGFQLPLFAQTGVIAVCRSLFATDLTKTPYRAPMNDLVAHRLELFQDNEKVVEYLVL